MYTLSKTAGQTIVVMGGLLFVMIGMWVWAGTPAVQTVLSVGDDYAWQRQMHDLCGATPTGNFPEFTLRGAPATLAFQRLGGTWQTTTGWQVMPLQAGSTLIAVRLPNERDQLFFIMPGSGTAPLTGTHRRVEQETLAPTFLAQNRD